MGWPRNPLAAKKPEASPVLAGLDVNTTRVRAVQGPPQLAPRALALDEARDELPMILSLEGRHPQVGRAGAALCRQSPHLACLDFLAHLGESREWVAGRHRLDPAKAMSVVFERLQAVCTEVRGMVLVLPAFITASAFLNVAGSTLASQVKKPSIVAMSGSIMPEPFAMPPTWKVPAAVSTRTASGKHPVASGAQGALARSRFGALPPGAGPGRPCRRALDRLGLDRGCRRSRPDRQHGPGRRPAALDSDLAVVAELERARLEDAFAQPRGRSLYPSEPARPPRLRSGRTVALRSNRGRIGPRGVRQDDRTAHPDAELVPEFTAALRGAGGILRWAGSPEPRHDTGRSRPGPAQRRPR